MTNALRLGEGYPQGLFAGSSVAFGVFDGVQKGAALRIVDGQGDGGAGGLGMRVHCHDLLHIGGKPVSSTRIRSPIAQGALKEAESLLGRPSCRSERQ